MTIKIAAESAKHAALVSVISFAGGVIAVVALSPYSVYIISINVLVGTTTILPLTIWTRHRPLLLVCLCSLLLGEVFSAAIAWIGMSSFSLYVCCMSFFHWSEFLATALTNPQFLSIDSFLLNHSWHYWMAALVGVTEHFTELFLVPEYKQLSAVVFIGMLMVVCGEVLRKLAMFTAMESFSHIVQCRKRSEHVLVTHGIYSLTRHPSYVGWFVWSVGTQVLLCNPICVILYIYVIWNFFNDRIFEEEFMLIRFFGHEYLDYQQNVPTGIPFIKGYLLTSEASQ